MNRSEQIGDLVGALALAKADYKTLKKSKVNPFFNSNYADLADVIEATEMALAKQGLAVIQGAEVKEGRVLIYTLLAHKTGQWIETQLSLKPGKDDAQGVGSTMTYGQRYSWQAIVGITGEPDDDGHASSQSPIPKPLAPSIPAFNIGNMKDVDKLIAGLDAKKIELKYHDAIAKTLHDKPFSAKDVDKAIKAVIGVK